MAAICTGTVSPQNCGHRTLTIALDGSPLSLSMHEGEAAEPLTAEEREQFLRLAVRWTRTSKGVTLANLLNRVVAGDEATNVKYYDVIGPGSAVTKTNIGAAWVNVLPGANGQRVLLDFTGCTEFRPVLTANLVGTGPFGVRIVRDLDDAILYENAALALTGERELDPGWLPLPAWATGLELVRLQAKSVTAADDPSFRRCGVLVR